MSFGDLGNQRPRPNNAQQTVFNVRGKDPILLLGETIQNFQSTKDKITEMRRRKVGPAEKSELDGQIKGIREQESNIKIQLDQQFQALDSTERSEAAQKRTALMKLQKDFDRIRVNLQTLPAEAALIKITREDGEIEKFNRIGGGNSANAKQLSNGMDSNDRYHANYSAPDNSRQPAQSGGQQMDIKPLLVGEEVDEAIMAERERDILQLNKDLQMVNEMFKDMADIVEKQGTQIKEVEASTDAAHQSAKQGLDQVKQAANYQPVCILS